MLEDEQAGHFYLDIMHLRDGSDQKGMKTGKSILNGSKDEKSNSKENGSDTSSSRQKEPKASFHLKLYFKRNLTRLIPFMNKKINKNMRMKQNYCWLSPRPIMTTLVPMAILLVTSLGLSCLPLSDMVSNKTSWPWECVLPITSFHYASEKFVQKVILVTYDKLREAVKNVLAEFVR